MTNPALPALSDRSRIRVLPQMDTDANTPVARLRRELLRLLQDIDALREESVALTNDPDFTLDPDQLRNALHLQARLESLLVHAGDAAHMANRLADHRPVRIPA